MTELLRVTDTFQITGKGLLVTPDFSYLAGGQSQQSFSVEIVAPNGTRQLTTARLEVMHFNIRDTTTPPEKRWRVLVVLPQLGKKDVEIGSALFVPTEVQAALRGTAGEA